MNPFLRQRLARLQSMGLFSLMAALGSGQLLAFAQKILLGRWLSQEDFARLSLLVESNTLLATLMTLALPTAMIRFGLKEGRMDYYFGGMMKAFLGLMALVALVFGLILAQGGLLADREANFWVGLTLLSAPGFALFNYGVNYLSAIKQAQARAKLVMAQRLGYFLLLVGGCLWLGWRGVVAGFFAFALGFGVYLLWRFRSQVFCPSPGFPWGRVLHFCGWDSLSYAAANGLAFVLLWMGERHLADLKPLSQLGMAFSFTVMAKLFFAAVINVIFPYLFEQKHKQAFARFLGKTLGGCLLGSLGMLGVAWWLVPWLIRLFLGEKYEGAVLLFQWLIGGEILIGFAQILETALEILGRIRAKAIFLLASLAALLALLPWALASFGVLGACYGFLIFAGLRLGLNLLYLALLWWRSPPELHFA